MLFLQHKRDGSESAQCNWAVAAAGRRRAGRSVPTGRKHVLPESLGQYGLVPLLEEQYYPDGRSVVAEEGALSPDEIHILSLMNCAKCFPQLTYCRLEQKLYNFFKS
jgi:hypothetical protein